MNDFGGKIKGDASVFLAQSATLADQIWVDFEDGKHQIPGGFYEFAKRYPLPDGSLYQGFVPTSADLIFKARIVMHKKTTSRKWFFKERLKRLASTKYDDGFAVR